ncbi:MAG: M949_RS01915 family surface polysaccharide biosynthesis protein [Bacteroidota bacterium]
MRCLLLFMLTALVVSCNSSGKKDSNKKMDDTARMDNPPVQVQKPEPVKGTAADVPATIKVKGAIQEVWKWNDNMGENLLITSVVAPFDDKEKNEYGEEGQTAELHAFHYVKKDGDYRQVWMMSDKEKACPFDITCEFIRDAISITDLDADGIAETTIQYKIACRSDVSPAMMKLILHEGETKYALRGLMWYGMEETKFEVKENNANLEKLPGYKGTDDEYFKTFGRYESEKDFSGAPPEFIAHVRTHWIRFVKESSE